MKKKNVFRLLGIIALVAVIGLTMTACPPGGGGGVPVDPTAITLSKPTLHLFVDGTETLSVNVEPANAGRSVTWESSNSAVATVDTRGRVRAVSTGNATITATSTSGGLTATCSVFVWHNPTSIEVTQAPTKTWYVVGDDPVLNTDGLVVTSVYDGGTEIIQNDAVTVSGFNTSSPGGREITVTWGGQSDTFTVTVVSITGINVAVPTPIKTALGEDLDILILEKITVTATYSDGKGTEDVTSRITLANISGFNKNTAGAQTLTVSYRPQVNSNTGTFTVTVLTVESIAVKTQPNKTKYAKGEALDIDGLTIEVTLSDLSKTTATPTLADISAFDSSSIGAKILTITYSGKTTTFTVTVIEVESIAVKTPPSKTRYAIGEALDITGLEIEATYNDNSKETLGTGTINLSYITGFSSAAATASQTVTVTYAGKPATFTVKVYAVVTFNPNGGNWSGSTVNQTKETEGNATVETPANPANATLSFLGWYTQVEGGTKLDSATRITANTNYYAQWGYIVTFNLNGGTLDGSSANKTVAVKENTAVANPGNPTHARATFANWYTEGGAVYNFATLINANITLYARWNFVVPLTDVTDVVPYLETLTTGGSAADPAFLPVSFNLGDMTYATGNWQLLLGAIGTANKFVNLDLSPCTMRGTEFNPDYSVATGKNKIVTIALPTAAASIPGNSYGTFRYFTALTSFSQTGTNLKTIGNYAFYECSTLTMTTLPTGITSIGDSAFARCSNLALTSLPAGITSIGAGAFMDCTNLALTSLPAGITAIGTQAFRHCENITITTLPTGVTSISTTVFGGCKKLTQITLHSGITSIGNNAFEECSNLALVICQRTTPPTLGTYVFVDTSASLQIKVPSANVNAYRTATNWSAYSSKISAQ